jgi:hypothetical protein
VTCISHCIKEIWISGKVMFYKARGSFFKRHILEHLLTLPQFNANFTFIILSAGGKNGLRCDLRKVHKMCNLLGTQTVISQHDAW